VKVEGLVFAGIASADPEALARFLGHALDVRVEQGDGVSKLAFANGSTLAVVPSDWIAPPSDTNLGFLVDDVEVAVAELAERGIEPTGPLLDNADFRYRHFRAPDGRTFELLDRRV
jgi:hypothetical protein